MSLFLGFSASMLIGISLGMIGGGGSILTIPVLVYMLDEAIMIFFALIMLFAAISMIRSSPKEAPSRLTILLINYPLIALAGALVGAVTGIVGVGGGFLIIPALVMLAYLPMKMAVGTSLLVIAAKSLIGFLGDLTTTRIDWAFLLEFTAFATVGIFIGFFLSRFISAHRLKQAFGWFVLLVGMYILSRETLLGRSLGPSRIHLPPDSLWTAPDIRNASVDRNVALIRYGRDLIVNTAYYLGPRGKVARLSNGMNCQNCHLDAGTRPWGNNFGAVASTYPKFRERSGTQETIVRRISDCFIRSLNGKAPDSNSREMQAMIAYIRFIGQSVPKGISPKGAGTWKVSPLNRAANPSKGEMVYQQKCITCHGPGGQGQFKPDRSGYTFPPLWGDHSYNNGAGLYRLTLFAGFIKANMPLGATWRTPQLTDEEAWDLAAYINSRPRPTKAFRHDWPNLNTKAIDYPYGPYADPFSERQHKYGPYAPIEMFRKTKPPGQQSKKVAKKT